MAKKNLSTSIAELLPENLGEDILNKLAELVSDYTVEKVNEEVKAYTEDLARKTRSFIRGQIEKLKEQAVKELELENETFRNAQLFETVRSIFATELTGEDELNGLNVLGAVSESQEQKIDVLVKEIDRLLQENIKLRNSAKVITDKNTMLESSVKKLTESVNKVTETKETKRMSDKAVIVSEQTFAKTETTEKKAPKVNLNENEWLGPDVMKAMKELNKKG